MSPEANTPIRLKGIAASPGIHIGRVALHHAGIAQLPPRIVPPSHVNREIRLLEMALSAAEGEIKDLREKVRLTLDDAHAAIFEPHLLLVQDPALKERTIDRIRKRHESAQTALMGVLQELAEQFAQIEDAHISSRASDVKDVGNRISKHLGSGRPGSEKQKAYSSDVIIFSHDLTPSDTAQMDTKRVKAFATEIGGPTSHTAILAKALEIPAVLGLGAFLRHAHNGTPAIVDGYDGTVIIHPTETDIKNAKNRRRRHLIRTRDYKKLSSLPAETIDGYRVELSANIEFPSEIPHIREHGAQGIGLFRTEFLYLKQAGLPSEMEQFKVYKEVLEAVSPGTVIFRTLDLGGDKFLQDALSRREMNPFLGMRAIRFCLRHPRLFSTQLRALLRASAFGRAKIMFPMVSSLSEVVQAKRLLEEAKRELALESIDFDTHVEVGIMIEIPSAALAADRLAQEVDFFSIGTNDLIQYTLAVDRSNEKVAEWYEPLHPAILRLIREVIDAAHRAGIWVGVCGEMAANPITALLLVGMGIDELSMGALDVPRVKYFLRNIRLSEARRLAGDISTLQSSDEIRKYTEMAYTEFQKRRIKEPVGEK